MPVRNICPMQTQHPQGLSLHPLVLGPVTERPYFRYLKGTFDPILFLFVEL